MSYSLYIDVTRLIRRQLQQLKPTGIDRVMLAYLKHYQDSARGVIYYFGRLWILSEQQSKYLFHSLLAGNLSRISLYAFITRVAIHHSLEKKHDGILLLLGHSDLERTRYAEEIKRIRLTPIFFIHDLIPISHPEYCRAGEKEKHTRRMIHALTLGKGIIVNSKDTYNALFKFALSLEKKLPAVCIAPLGVDLPQSRLYSRTMDSPYFVVIGTIEPRKNHIMLLYVWQNLIKQLGSKAPKLIIIGRRGWECEHITRMLDRCSKLRGFVFEWNRCSDEELSSCLQHAQALLFPSFVEGYGLPLIEALNAGVPVIASTTPALVEIGDNIPEYVDPLDTVQWINIITNYAQPDSRLRQAQKKRLTDYKAPSWRKHFLISEHLIQSIANQNIVPSIPNNCSAFAISTGPKDIHSSRQNLTHSMIYAWRMPYWKRPIIRRFLAAHTVRFVRRTRSIKPGSVLLLWGSRPTPPKLRGDVSVARLEDGFLRSVGLGAALTRPLSWVIDTQGIYYNGTKTSDLENILQYSTFTEPLLERAASFHQRIVAHGVTKYNLKGQAWKPPANEKRIILVPGQVETDASIAFGTGVIKTNIELLRAVRAKNPDAWIIYKPHPDIVAGLRAKGIDEHKTHQYCDEYLDDVSIEHLLKYIDEVHVMTSLAGFEALLRGKAVTCYGLPFYAGWGLTTDMMSTPRRTRKLKLDELIAGALLLYPMYISWDKGTRVAPEEALEELISGKQLIKTGKVHTLFRVAYRTVRKLTRFYN
ncbi:hypothetical protein DGG96_11820 [Legionella qingyii]|uniref:Glycosyltransferase n=1 Tax=Legionella qingyii TaxID=2184757 RepID=A0A317U4Z8_9GAMM|nr:glycosyltransferase [Legionella qingyii]PWY55460.1 hypothetical protein DGG96_11820 [Legionella qingyii]RUR21336.1 glycosyltransferase [Legionella qingyii]RUR24560.1 glycosyltransferase [Legionella qingyii]